MSIYLQSVKFAALASVNGHTSYEQQAKATGLGLGTISRLHNGSPASSSSVAAICNTYGVEFADLFIIGASAPAPTAAAA